MGGCDVFAKTQHVFQIKLYSITSHPTIRFLIRSVISTSKVVSKISINLVGEMDITHLPIPPSPRVIATMQLHLDFSKNIPSRALALLSFQSYRKMGLIGSRSYAISQRFRTFLLVNCNHEGHFAKDNTIFPYMYLVGKKLYHRIISAFL